MTAVCTGWAGDHDTLGNGKVVPGLNQVPCHAGVEV